MFKRVFLIVMDGLGVGEAKDAKKYDCEGANTLKHALEGENYYLPLFEKLGLLSLVGEGSSPKCGYYGVLNPKNLARDTLNGHYEMMGNIFKKPFMTYPNGFPLVLISEIQRVTGREVICNRPASGTEIIKELGEEHMKSGALIVYTSEDSVLQIAAHEDIIPVEELYDICEKVSKLIFNEEYKIARVIARPFVGTNANDFKRTAGRRDFVQEPPRNYMELLYENGYDVIALGKIKDIFADKNITSGIKTTNNLDGLLKITDVARTDFNGLCFLNLNDFDTVYGHRRDKVGYKNCIEELDHNLYPFFKLLKEDDLVIFTADHGNDPTYKGTDHTREKVPFILYSPGFKYRGKLPEGDSFANIGATIIDNFGIKNDLKVGDSVLKYLK